MQRIKNRKEILPRIIEDNIELYELIDDKFAKRDQTIIQRLRETTILFGTRSHPHITKNFRDNLCDVLKYITKPIGEGRNT